MLSYILLLYLDAVIQTGKFLYWLLSSSALLAFQCDWYFYIVIKTLTPRFGVQDQGKSSQYSSALRYFENADMPPPMLSARPRVHAARSNAVLLYTHHWTTKVYSSSSSLHTSSKHSLVTFRPSSTTFFGTAKLFPPSPLPISLLTPFTPFPFTNPPFTPLAFLEVVLLVEVAARVSALTSASILTRHSSNVWASPLRRSSWQRFLMRSVQFSADAERAWSSFFSILDSKQI